jgi:Domain of unknown function (DUF4440)
MKLRIATIALLAVAGLLLSLNVMAQAPKADDAKAIAEITQWENDSVKADLAGDASFYDKSLAPDWSAVHSWGETQDKAADLADIKDTKNNKMNSRSIANLKVRVYGDTAIATYEDTYDSLMNGKPLARTVISTDTFVRQNGMWKQVASQSTVKGAGMAASQ